MYVDWVLWHINHCRSFNAKFSLYIYIYIKYIGLVNTYKLYKLEFICLHTAK